tara:strand:- start:1251 stop:1946 length:696 start_codon:yes stop_codon:yes gene_type:complete
MAGERKEFQEYLDDYDRTKRGAGSKKKPPTDRFSGKDVRYAFREGLDRGLSKAEAARDVIDYFDEVRNETKYGGATREAIKKLRGYLKDDDVLQGEDDQVVGVDPIPDRGQFGDPTRTDPGMFASSYFDYLGTGDPSDPRQYYMYGFDGPVGLARADRPVRTDRFGVPADIPSFLSDGPLAPYFQTESEFQEENRRDLGDIFGDAAKGAGASFLDSVLAGVIGGIRDEIRL